MLSFAVIDQGFTNGFGNVTVPKTAVPDGATPIAYVDNGVVSNQGFTQDAQNFYVWYETSYSTYELSIVFGVAPLKAGFSSWVVFALVIVGIESILTFAFRKKLRVRAFKVPKLFLD